MHSRCATAAGRWRKRCGILGQHHLSVYRCVRLPHSPIWARVYIRENITAVHICTHKEEAREGDCVIERQGNNISSNSGTTNRPDVWDRFWSKVARGSGCWLWGAGRSAKGYGRFAYQGKNQRAHRVAWKLFRGPIPAGMDVLHECDNRLCMHPFHLYLGTNNDNVDDKVRRGRQPHVSGERNGNSKITETQAEEIRQARDAGISSVALAKIYPISPHAVRDIGRRKLWAS